MTPERLRRIGVMQARLHRVALGLAQQGAIATSRRAYETDLARWAQGSRPRTAGLSARMRRIAQHAA